MKVPSFFILFLCLNGVGIEAAQWVDLNAPFVSQSAKSVLQAPTAFACRGEPGTFFLLPLSYRVQEKNGRPQLKFRKFQNGKARVEAALVPFPESFDSHPAYQALIDEIKAVHANAKFLYPVLRSPKVTFLGPSGWAEAVDLIGSTGGDPNLRNLTIMVRAEHAAEIEEHLKRPLGLMGKLEFQVRAFSGAQELEWPIGFAFHVGDYHAP
jgi:hypothetical protein